MEKIMTPHEEALETLENMLPELEERTAAVKTAIAVLTELIEKTNAE
jgi:hypothetical protein